MALLEFAMLGNSHSNSKDLVRPNTHARFGRNFLC